MSRPYPAFYPIVGLCAVLAACSGKADKLSDVELARMLHTEGLADERVDAAAVDCLRAWSGDGSLASGLPTELSSDDGKNDCRRHMQGWLDDGSRNPQGLMFADVSTKNTAKRAMTLLAALPPLETPAIVDPGTSPAEEAPLAEMPTAPLPGAAADVPADVAEAAFADRVNVANSTHRSLDEFDAACEEALQLAKVRQFPEGALQRISTCKQTASHLRSRVNEVVGRGTAFDVSMATRGADQELQLIRSAIAASK